MMGNKPDANISFLFRYFLCRDIGVFCGEEFSFSDDEIARADVLFKKGFFKDLCDNFISVCLFNSGSLKEAFILGKYLIACFENCNFISYSCFSDFSVYYCFNRLPNSSDEGDHILHLYKASFGFFVKHSASVLRSSEVKSLLSVGAPFEWVVNLVLGEVTSEEWFKFSKFSRYDF